MTRCRVPIWGFVALVAFGLAAVSPPAEARRRSRRARTVVIEPRTAEGLPNVQSRAAIVIDTVDGTELYAKNPDEVRHIASTTKIFVAMLVRRKGIDLDAYTEITDVDRGHARGGARTRLVVGGKYTNRDLLIAMLVASDNRAPTALGRAVDLGPEQLVAEMNVLARDLGLTQTRFTDPSGLNGNESTAREMAVAFAATMEDPVLAEIMSTHEAIVRPERGRAIHYYNTNLSLRSGRHDVVAGKTGFTTPAGYCLVTAARTGDRSLVFVFLGSEGKLTRFGDFNRVVDWLLDDTAPKPAPAIVDPPADGAAAAPRGVGKNALPPAGPVTPRIVAPAAGPRTR